MLKSLATTLLNRLVFLIALFLIVSAYARTGCSAGDSPFEPVAKAISGLKELATALQKR